VNQAYVFSFTDFSARYPTIATAVGQTLLTAYFPEACMYCDNTACSVIPYDPTCTPPVLNRELILNALVAHIAILDAITSGTPIPGFPLSPLVGRINAATQGSVSVNAELNVPGSAAYFAQTGPGLSAWQMMAGYRTARYFASLGRYAFAGAPFPFRGGIGFGGFR
jgi:hypothetical protein